MLNSPNSLRVLLDECLPKKLKREFVNCVVSTVPEMGWAGKKNGELMKVAHSQFDVFVTADQNLQYQQNLAYADIGVVVLVAINNRIETLTVLDFCALLEFLAAPDSGAAQVPRNRRGKASCGARSWFNNAQKSNTDTHATHAASQRSTRKDWIRSGRRN